MLDRDLVLEIRLLHQIRMRSMNLMMALWYPMKPGVFTTRIARTMEKKVTVTVKEDGGLSSSQRLSVSEPATSSKKRKRFVPSVLSSDSEGDVPTKNDEPAVESDGKL
jgi:hypothetical protein